MQNAKTPMVIAILNNVLNIVLSMLFVFGFGMKVAGIALGTMVSQVITLVVCVLMWLKFYGRLRKYIVRSSVLETAAIRSYFRVNGDVFVRTFLLTLVTTFFTFVSSGMGDMILAANALLMQFFWLFSYCMGGCANAGEALTGMYIGADNKVLRAVMRRRLFFRGFSVSSVSGMSYGCLP